MQEAVRLHSSAVDLFERQFVVSGLTDVNMGPRKKQSEFQMDFIRLNKSPGSMSSQFTKTC